MSGNTPLEMKPRCGPQVSLLISTLCFPPNFSVLSNSGEAPDTHGAASVFSLIALRVNL